jgi:hypothetical protein
MAPDGATFTTTIDIPQSSSGPQTAGGDFGGGYALGVTHTLHNANVGLSGELAIIVTAANQYATVNGFQIVPLAGVAEAMGEAPGDQFGYGVANVGDVNADDFDDFIVGAPYSDENGIDAGKIYVYSGLTGEILYTDTGNNAGDWLGYALAGAGDVNDDGHSDFIVGAPHYDHDGSDDGIAYVYSGATFGLLYTKIGVNPGDHFGLAVAGGRDVNQDGHSDFIVGAPDHDYLGTSTGQVYVYSGATGGKLKTLSGKHKGDKFGISVAIAKKINGDANADIIVGAPYNDDEATNAGKVYVYSGQNFAILYTFEGLKKGDQFGRSVAAAGWVDSDFRDDFVVGSPYYDKTSQPNVGRIDVFSGKTGVKLWGSIGALANDRFGWTVGGPGDVNGDGHADIITVGPWSDSAGNDAGRAVIRSGANASTILSTGGYSAGDRFGWGVAGLTDIVGQGYNDVVVGAPLNDTTGANAGRVYVLSFAPNDDPGPQMAMQGGESVKVSIASVTPPPANPAPAADAALSLDIDSSCPHDLNDDGLVDVSDLVELLQAWGICDQCPNDFTGDDTIDSQDVQALMQAWGPC